MYAYFKKLDYFSTECIYAPNAYRGHARSYLKDLEAIRPSSIIGNFASNIWPSRRDFTFLLPFFRRHPLWGSI